MLLGVVWTCSHSVPFSGPELSELVSWLLVEMVVTLAWKVLAVALAKKATVYALARVSCQARRGHTHTHISLSWINNRMNDLNFYNLHPSSVYCRHTDFPECIGGLPNSTGLGSPTEQYSDLSTAR